MLVALDRHRHRNQIVNIGFGDMDAITATLIVEKLQTQGIEAAFFETTEEWEGELESYRGISCRNADREIVRRVVKDTLS